MPLVLLIHCCRMQSPCVEIKQQIVSTSHQPTPAIKVLARSLRQFIGIGIRRRNNSIPQENFRDAVRNIPLGARLEIKFHRHCWLEARIVYGHKSLRMQIDQTAPHVQTR